MNTTFEALRQFQTALWRAHSGERHEKAWPYRLWAGLVASFWGVVAFRPFVESDVFWHLTLGRAVLEHGLRTVPEPTAWDNFGQTAIVQEWLWDAVSFKLWQWGGWTALGILWIALAMLAALACCYLARVWAPKLSVAGVMLTTTAISPLVLTRIGERPETAALVLLPITMTAAHALSLATAQKRRWTLATALIGLTVLWVQLHPTAVIAPVVAAIILSSTLGYSTNRATTTPSRAAILGMLAALLTGAHGIGIFENVWAHSQGDAIQHIVDMAPVSWAHFDLSGALHFPLYGLCLLLGAFLGLRLRPLPWRELLLAFLGLAMVITANRGVGPAGILTLPLLARCSTTLPAAVAWRIPLSALLAVFCGYVGIRSYSFYDHAEQSGFHLAKEQFPLAAAQLLRKAPPNTKVLSSYQAGAPIGFLLEGKVRTFVDSRTPVMFDDADLALARTIWNSKEGFERAASRYGFDYVVTERSSTLCTIVAQDPQWALVLTEPGFSTFAKRSERMLSPPLTQLEACGRRFIKEDACGTDRGKDLKQQVHTLAAIQDSPFVMLLRGQHLALCYADRVATQTILSMVPSASEAAGFQRPRNELLAWIHASQGRIDAAVAAVEPFAARGDADILLPILPLLDQAGQFATLQRLLMAVFKAKDDASPPWIFATLAKACAQLNDTACVAFFAPRAAAWGHIEVGPALCWLSDHHPEPSVRNEAERWLLSLRTETEQQRTSPDPLRCLSP